MEQPDREPFEDAEVVDGLPVVAPPAEVAPAVPAREIAVLAATGFVAGAATVAMVTRRRARVAARRRPQRATPLGEIVASNSFLIDVHLLRRE